MKRMGMMMVVLMTAFAVRAAEPTELPRRAYRIGATALERIASLAEAIPKEELPAEGEEDEGYEKTWKAVFKELGLSWPEGSSIGYLKSRGELVVFNTEENHRKLEKLIAELSELLRRVEIDVRVVAASRSALESVGYFEFTRPAATNLYAKLRTRKDVTLVSSPCLVTESGVEAVVKGVTEYIYPTDYDVNAGAEGGFCCTNHCTRQPGSGIATVEPQSFTMREVGTILDVTPEFLKDSNGAIDLQLNLQYVGTPEWKDYGQTVPAAKDRAEGKLPMEQPFFPVVSVDTHTTLRSGATEVFGGVTDGTEKGKDTFYLFFVTPRIVDIAGKEVRQ